jgi:hypothetical protein
MVGVSGLNAVCVRPASAQIGQTDTSAASSPLSQDVELAPISPSHRSARADVLLKGGPPLTTFEAVSLILERGHEVIVTESDGKRTRGLVSSVPSDGLMLFRKAGLFSRARDVSYRSENIDTIQVVDSSWNGLLVGLAVTAGSLLALRSCEGECQGTAAYAGLVGGAAPVAGWAIDDAVNGAVYERGRGTLTVSLAPISQRDAIGAIVRVGS